MATTGIIDAYDPEEESGYILIDNTDDRVPFDAEGVEDFRDGAMLSPGQAVTFRVEGGMAGTFATHVRRVARPT